MPEVDWIAGHNQIAVEMRSIRALHSCRHSWNGLRSGAGSS